MKKLIFFSGIICAFMLIKTMQYKDTYIVTDFSSDEWMDEYYATIFIGNNIADLEEYTLEQMKADGAFIEGVEYTDEQIEIEWLTSQPLGLRQNLTMERADAVVLATPEEDFKVKGGVIHYNLNIKQVCKGDESLEGKTIATNNYLPSVMPIDNIEDDPEMDAKVKNVFGGAVAPMKKGEEYLVFLTRIEINNQYDKYLLANCQIPYFNLKTGENEVHSVVEGLPLYREVAGEEFHFKTQKAKDYVLNLKEELIEQYVNNS